MNITIIGAGPIGCYAGYLLAQSGHTVNIYENHAKIGLPIQCTGLLTSDFDQFNLEKKSFLINTLTNIEVHTPNNKITFENQKEYLVNRKKFDQYLAHLAQQAGATIHLNHSFHSKEGNNLIIKNTKTNTLKIITPEIIIAADGPLSPTTKAFNLYHKNRKNYYGIQAIVKGNFNSNTYQTFFKQETCPDLFAWIVPESKTKARVGLASKQNSKELFDKFIKEHNFQPLEIQAGLIPLYEPKQIIHKDNLYILGDASSFVKATTLGGLIPGLKQAEILVDSINHKKNYQKQLHPLKKTLNLHLKIHHLLTKFSNKDWDYLAQLLNQPKIKKIISHHTRENPLPILTKSLIKEPRFLKFAKHLF